jgi:hypothetical protein
MKPKIPYVDCNEWDGGGFLFLLLGIRFLDPYAVGERSFLFSRRGRFMDI